MLPSRTGFEPAVNVFKTFFSEVTVSCNAVCHCVFVCHLSIEQADKRRRRVHFSALSAELQDHKLVVPAGLEPATSRTRIEVSVLCNAACSMKRCSVPVFSCNNRICCDASDGSAVKAAFYAFSVKLRKTGARIPAGVEPASLE